MITDENKHGWLKWLFVDFRKESSGKEFEGLFKFQKLVLGG